MVAIGKRQVNTVFAIFCKQYSVKFVDFELSC